MTDEQANGATGGTRGGRFRQTVENQKRQVEGAFQDARGRSLDAYGRAMDSLDRLAERAPESVRPRARSTIAAARNRPLLTSLAVAGLGLLLARAARRR